MIIGRTIKAYRRAKKITLKELAEKVGTTASFLSDVENNKKQPSMDTLGRLAHAFGVPVYLLFKEPLDIVSESQHTLNGPNQDSFMIQARALFLSDNLTEEDKEAIFKDITDLYWKAKGLSK